MIRNSVFFKVSRKSSKKKRSLRGQKKVQKKVQKKTSAASRPIFFKKKRQKLQNKTIIFIENTLNILKINVFGRR